MRACLCFLLLLLPALLPAQAKTEQQLRALELQRFEAMSAKDTAFLSHILSDDLTYTHSNGLVETKTEHIGNIKSGTIIYRAMQSDGMDVRIFGKSAVITGYVRVAGVFREKEFALRLRYLDIYTKQKGKWKLVAWQSVRVDD